jgi:biotin-dependent carboxylase-like uncharacterized protein
VPSENPVLRIVRPGPFTTLQDGGRPGRGHQGVARSGAFDQGSFRLANRLVGNVESAPVLEVVFGPFEFEVLQPLVFAIAGTNATIDIISDTGSQGSPANAAIAANPGERVVIGVPTIGLRTYLSLRGGFDASSVLGSSSYDSLGQIGPRPLAVNENFGVGPQATSQPLFDPYPTRPSDDPTPIPVRLGPRHDWLDAGAVEALHTTIWVVDTASNRTGVRLTGTPLRRRTGDLASEAMITGAIQLPPNGQPIVLGPDGGTTGGYPVIGVVRRDGLDLLAQRRPGDLIRFKILR